MPQLPNTLETIIIEHVEPELDGGRYPVKRIVGERLEVTADIFKEGHDIIIGILRYKIQGDKHWQETAMHHVDNDRWAGSFLLSENTRYLYSLGAYIKSFETWRTELTKKHGVIPDLASELLEGEAQLHAAMGQAKGPDLATFKDWVSKWKAAPSQEARIAVALHTDLALLVALYEHRAAWSTYPLELSVVVDRERARYGAWYEIFPRSEGTIEGQGGTFKDCEARLPAIRDMGFDVLYLTPVHPIGETNRKGRNNSLTAQPGEPGSPWAIGSRHGGHDAVEPAIGTLEDFDQLQRAVRNHGMEIALDFAINATPDHPYVTQHPEWFKQRPDGTIKYAENPPKKYEDIYGFDFYSDAWPEIWQEMKRVFLFWIQHGVKIFRVDNPHTKPVIFWEWVIGEIQHAHPDVLFLAEAFTKPKMMRVLAKAGFTQSYTYFTWRNSKAEIIEYLTELTQSEMREYFRPNFFPNTPDILPPILQQAGQPAFKFRVFLAATLSTTYGIYNSYELCENRALPGTEEYQDSEKYEIRHWDWDRPGNIRDYITRINQIRRDHPALQSFTNLKFHPSDNEHVLFYGKTNPDKTDILLFVVNMDPYHTQEARLTIPLEEFGIHETATYHLHELIQGYRHDVVGRDYSIRLDPNHEPSVIFQIQA
ncbi:MAG: alpha-1,4-glucan--maltose-1-phosphate maltosyltransferase [Nitrospirales bacterium]